MTNDDKIIQQLADKLRKHEVDLPANDWDVLASKIQAKKRRPALLWWYGAAASIVALMIGGFVWMQVGIDDAPDMMAQQGTATEQTAATPEQKNTIQTANSDSIATDTEQNSAPQTQQEKKQTVKQALQITPKKLLATADQQAKTATTATKTAATSRNDEPQAATTKSDASKNDNATAKTSQTSKATTAEAETKLPQGVKQLTIEEAEALMAQADEKNRNADDDNRLKKVPQQRNAVSLGVLGRVSPSTESGFGAFETNSGMRMMANNGRPSVGLKSLSNQIAQHDMPFSVGISVGIPIVERFEIKTGLTYTYVHSKFLTASATSNAFTSTTDQALHYLGIPVMPSYRIVDKEWIEFYTSLGGMVEKGLVRQTNKQWIDIDGYATSSEAESTKIEGFQFSLAANVGVAFTIYRSLNIYFEPGFTWYIPNKIYAQPTSLRTENPYYISLTAGVRFSIPPKNAK